MVHGKGGPARCAICRSYRLHVDYEPGDGFGVLEVLICDKCGWRADGTYIENDEPTPPRAPPEGDCTTVDVPLYPRRRPR